MPYINSVLQDLVERVGGGGWGGGVGTGFKGGGQGVGPSPFFKVVPPPLFLNFNAHTIFI